MVDPLGLYLRAAALRAFDRADHNCGLWVARWVAARTGINPGADWSGEFEIDLEATAVIVMQNFERTKFPRRGDVGVVLAPRPTAAIFLGHRWAALAPSGLAIAPWDWRRAWRVEPQAPYA